MKKIFCKHYYTIPDEQEVFIEGYYNHIEKTMSLYAFQYVVTTNPLKSEEKSWLIGVFDIDSLSRYINEKIKRNINLFSNECLEIYEYALNYLREQD